MSTLRTTTLKHGGSTILDNLVLSNAGETRFCPNSSFGRAALYVDGQTNRVGVNTESPGVALDVDGAINATGNATLGGTLAVTGITTLTNDLVVDTNTLFVDVSTNRVGVGTSSPDTLLHVAFANGSPQLILERTGTSTGKYSLAAVGNEFRITDEAQSAERFRINSSGNVGIGTTSMSNKLEVDGGSAETRLRVSTTGTDADEAGIILANSGKTAFNDGIEIAHGAGKTNFNDLAGEAQMTIDVTSSRVGIGSTSPGAKLHIANTGGNADLVLQGSASGESIINFGDTADLDVGQILYNHSSNYMRFLTNTSESMRIDSSGRLLVGTFTARSDFGSTTAYRVQVEGTDLAGSSLSLTRNTNSNAGPGLQFAKSRASANGGNVIVQNNDVLAYILFDGNDGTDFARAAQITAEVDGTPGNNDMPGRLVFSTTADGSSSPTERLRIDSSGRLLLGTGGSSVFVGSPTAATLQVNHDTSSTTFAAWRSGGSGIIVVGGTSSGNNGAVAANTVFGEYRFAGGDGNDLQSIGATIQAYSDGSAWTEDNAPTRLVFSTTADGASSPTERMRIDKYGTHTLKSQDVPAIYAYRQTTSANSIQVWQSNNGGTASTKGYFKADGGLANYQSNDVNLSDEREKKNVETLDSTWSCLKNWDLKKFHYNEDADTDDKRYGVIAQQVAEHCPEVITDWVKQEAKDAELDQDGNVVTPAVEEVVRMGVKEQQMMWMAVKALQEAMDRIETLEAKVAALESE